MRFANLPPVRRSVGLLPGTSFIDILPRLAGMLGGLVGDSSRVTENDPRIITFAHDQQGYRRSDDHLLCSQWGMSGQRSGVRSRR